MNVLVRAAVAAVIGAAAGAISFVGAFALHPQLTLDMDRDLPRFAFGFYPPEVSNVESFAWTSARAQLNIVDLNRRSAWRCGVTLRGGRPVSVPPGSVQIAVDGVVAASAAPTNEYQTIDVVAPANPGKRGLNLAIATEPTFVPAAGDSRALGVQVDRIQCSPEGSAIPVTPRRALIAATMTAAVFGLGFALTGVSLHSVVAAVLVVAVLQAIPLSAGSGAYGPYLDRVVTLSEWIAAGMVVIIQALDWVRRERLRPEARFAVAFSCAGLFLYSVGLLHPQKLVIDAVFHAHRLQWVMDGRYFFTQPMPNGVEFPYAIALYVAAAPWTAVARDHVALLRLFVCTAQLSAGTLLYWMVVRNWTDRANSADRLAGAIAVALFSVVPMPFVVLGNANLTNAFGQAMALAAVAIATAWLGTASRAPGRYVLQAVVLTVVVSIALLSHVSTFALLMTTMSFMAAAYWTIGGRALRPAALTIVAAALVAMAAAVLLYYAHFGDVYRNLSRASGSGASAAAMPFVLRLARALRLGVGDVGAPILLLAAAGAWQTVTARTRDRLTCALAAYAATWVVFVLFSTIVSVGADFDRYTVEFLSRVDYGLYPAVVVLAGRGAAWAWRRRMAWRLAAAAGVAAAFVLGLRQWMNWFS